MNDVSDALLRCPVEPPLCFCGGLLLHLLPTLRLTGQIEAMSVVFSRTSIVQDATIDDVRAFVVVDFVEDIA